MEGGNVTHPHASIKVSTKSHWGCSPAERGQKVEVGYVQTFIAVS